MLSSFVFTSLFVGGTAAAGAKGIPLDAGGIIDSDLLYPGLFPNVAWSGNPDPAMQRVTLWDAVAANMNADKFNDGFGVTSGTPTAVANQLIWKGMGPTMFPDRMIIDPATGEEITTNSDMYGTLGVDPAAYSQGWQGHATGYNPYYANPFSNFGHTASGYGPLSGTSGWAGLGVGFEPWQTFSLAPHPDSAATPVQVPTAALGAAGYLPQQGMNSRWAFPTYNGRGMGTGMNRWTGFQDGWMGGNGMGGGMGNYGYGLGGQNGWMGGNGIGNYGYGLAGQNGWMGGNGIGNYGYGLGGQNGWMGGNGMLGGVGNYGYGLGGMGFPGAHQYGGMPQWGMGSGQYGTPWGMGGMLQPWSSWGPDPWGTGAVGAQPNGVAVGEPNPGTGGGRVPVA